MIQLKDLTLGYEQRTLLETVSAARQKRHRKKYTAACRHGTGKAPKRRDYPARE